MRCDVLLSQDPRAVYPDAANTDIEVWREGSGYKKALVSTGPRDIAKYITKNTIKQLQKGSPNQAQTKQRCQKSEAPQGNGKFFTCFS